MNKDNNRYTTRLANNKSTKLTSDALCGVVALVEVGKESRALPLRAALAALGATVFTSWSPLVTHLVWTDGGCRSVRAKARALGCRLVSPLWVEACAASNTKLNERTFPTVSRKSDLPSPRTLRQLLKRAESENVPLVDLLTDSKEDDSGKHKPLRISTDSEQDTSADKTNDTSNDTIDVESRVNTALRRALPMTSISLCPDRPSKSRRKLFTQKEGELLKKSDDESDSTFLPKRKRVLKRPCTLTQREKKDLAIAERMAKKMLSSCTQDTRNNFTQNTNQYRIVLTGMSRNERQIINKAIQELNGRIQSHVTKRTTHVLLGSCRNDSDITATTNCYQQNNRHNNRNQNFDITGITSHNKTMNGSKENNRHEDRNGDFESNHKKNGDCGNNRYKDNVRNNDHVYNLCNDNNRTVDRENNRYDDNDRNDDRVNNRYRVNGQYNDRNGDRENNRYNSNGIKARTLNALQGAARGCRVLHSQWAIDSAGAGKWIHHHGYEVHHLRKICEKARVERTALGLIHSEYAYDVFNGIRIRITRRAEQKDAAIQLLKLCGAVVHEDTQNGGRLQDGGRCQNGRSVDCDIIIGCDAGEVNSKWVFDSVAAGRMRNTRKYIYNI